MIDKTKLRRILMGQKTLELLAIWFSILGDDKGLLVDKILDASDDELFFALNINLGWNFKGELK